MRRCIDTEGERYMMCCLPVDYVAGISRQREGPDDVGSTVYCWPVYRIPAFPLPFPIHSCLYPPGYTHYPPRYMRGWR